MDIIKGKNIILLNADETCKPSIVRSNPEECIRRTKGYWVFDEQEFLAQNVDICAVVVDKRIMALFELFPQKFEVFNKKDETQQPWRTFDDEKADKNAKRFLGRNIHIRGLNGYDVPADAFKSDVRFVMAENNIVGHSVEDKIVFKK